VIVRTLPLLALCLVGCSAARSQAPAADPTALKKDLARALIERHEWAMASRPLIEISRVSPKDPEIWLLLGAAYREQGLYDDAQRAFERSIALRESGEAWAGLGLTRELRGDQDEAALDDLRRAIALQPNSASHHNNLGFAFYVRGRHPEAIAAYQSALALAPTLSRVRNNLGFAFARKGEMGRAESEFQRAGGPAAAQCNLGFFLEQERQLAAACLAYRNAEALDPRLASAREGAGRVCQANRGSLEVP
jgi:Flp pilus assembly protein TadD